MVTCFPNALCSPRAEAKGLDHQLAPCPTVTLHLWGCFLSCEMENKGEVGFKAGKVLSGSI